MIDWLVDQMAACGDELALATPGASYTYAELLDRVREWRGRFAELPAGRIVSIEGDYGAESIAVFLAAIWTGHVAIPLSPLSRALHAACLDIAAVEYRVCLDDQRASERRLEPTGRHADHPLYAALRTAGHPGLVLFSSGSTGQPKAALHDLARLLAKYRVPRRRYRTLVFLLLDHIGGVNTLFYTLSNGGAVVLAADRSPAAVCEAIETHRVELLPTSPTFLNLLLLSGEARDARPRLAEAHHLRHRADAGEHAGAGVPGVSAGAVPADLRPDRARDPALAVARVGLALGAHRRRGLRVEGRGRPAVDPRPVGDARLPQRAEPVRRRRLLRHRRPGGGGRRVDPLPRPQERRDQRRRQQGAPGGSRERAPPDGARR